MSLRSWFPLRKRPYQIGHQRRSPGRSARRKLLVELLEDRTLLSGNTLALAQQEPLQLTDNLATASGYLAASNDVQLYQINLSPGEVATASVQAQSIGSGLNSYLRIFSSSGKQIFANDNFNGTDSSITFQASPTDSVYYIGVSASGNTTYDPTTAPSLSQANLQVGATSGLFQLSVTVQPGQTSVADLTAASFSVSQSAAMPGDTLGINYRIENRGGTASGSYTVDVLLSTDNRFDVAGNTTVIDTIIGQTGLAADGSFTTTTPLSVTLPDLLGGSSYSGTYYIGLEITPGGGTGSNLAFNNNAVSGTGWAALNVLTPYTNGSSLLNEMAGDPSPLSGTQSFTITVPQNGLLSAIVQNTTGTTQLTLLQNGQPLIQSAGATDTIQQYLTAGTYVLEVTPLSGSPLYRISTVFTPGASPVSSISLPNVESEPDADAIVTGDFNGDGIPDLAVALIGSYTEFTVLPGLGNGNFGSPITSPSPTGQPIFALYSADFNNDGLTDLVTVDMNGTVSVLLSQGNGQFTPSPSNNLFATTDSTYPLIAIGDFNNDGKIDLAIGTPGPVGTGMLSVYLGNGDGTFTALPPLTIANMPAPPQTISNDFAGPLAVGRFYTNANQTKPNEQELGQLDIIAASGTVLLGNGDGTFTQIQDRTIASLGDTPDEASSIAVADLNGDGYPDLIEAPQTFSGVLGHAITGFLSISYGNGDGTFTAPIQLTTPQAASIVAAIDLNGDGHWDIAYQSISSTSVLLGTGLGGSQPFQPAQSFTLPLAAGANTGLFAVADFNGDGRVDIATLNNPTLFSLSQPPSNSTVTIVFGAGDGTLITDTNPELDERATSLVAADFTNNGLDDLASANIDGNDLSVLMSEGNGLFQSPVNYTFSGLEPTLLVTGDFNGDGRLDLAAYFPPDGGLPPGFPGTIAVFFGVGDGTFTFATSFSDVQPTLSAATSMFAADLNGDGLSDLIVGQNVYLTSRTSNGIASPKQPSFVLPGPVAAVGDFNGNHIPDLIVGNGGEEILLGNGDGSFTAGQRLGSTTGSVQLGDFNDDGITDVAVETSGTTIAIWTGVGDGTFNPAPSLVGSKFGRFVVGDFSGDGYDDLAILTTGTSPDLLVYLNNQDGTFTESSQEYSVRRGPTSMIVGDFNGDGRPDIAISSWLTLFPSQLTILLGQGNGTFIDPTTGTNPTPQAVPLVGDFTGDGTPDVVVLDAQGNILFRPGVPGQTGVFGPPILVNPDTPARDVALLTDTVDGVTTVRIAALDLDDDKVSIYSLSADEQFSLTGTLATGLLPTRIVSADLNGDGLYDLIVINSGDNTLSVYLADNNAPGGFDVSNYALAGGSGPFDVTTAQLDNNGGEDILVSNAISGTIGIYLNQGNGSFGAEQIFAAGTGPFGMSSSSSVSSPDSTEGLVVGRFDESDSGVDVVAVNANTDTFSLLGGNDDGTLSNPSTFLAGSQPTLVVAGDFNGDRHQDLAILNEATDTISIYLGDGKGNFTAGQVLSAGNAPTGLSVADIDGDGKLDLLVGNAYGDVLILHGNGDGTFASYQRLDSYVSLAVFNQSGQSDIVLGNQGEDRVSMQNAQGSNTPLLSRNNSLLAPQVFQADLNLDGYEDLIVVNSGGNSINVYFGGPNGIDFNNSQTYFVGTNPDFVLVADINNDGNPDLLIANQGSNDVSILFGSGQKNADGSISNWTATIGPRIAVGRGPNSLALADVVHIVAGQTELGPAPGGVLDLIVSNQGSNSLWIVPGVGDGFFKDSGAIVVPGLSGQLLVNGTGAFLVDAATGAVHFIPDLTDPTNNFTIDGLGAVSGITGEFGDGASDALVVTETGIADLILGNADGISIAANFDTTLKDPGEMALSAQQSGLFSFYVSYVNTQNVEAAQQFALELRGGDLVAVGTQLNLSAVDDSSLALVALLLSSNATSGPGETAAGSSSSPEFIPTGNSLALAQTLLDLDSHYTPNDGGTSSGNAPSGNAAALGGYLSSVGSQVQAEMALASKLLPLVLAEIGTALESGLGGVNSDPARLSWAFLAPLQEVGKLSADAIKQIGQSVITGFGKQAGFFQSLLPPAAEEGLGAGQGQGEARLSLDYILALSFLEGDTSRIGMFDTEERRAAPLFDEANPPVPSVALREPVEALDLLPSVLLAAGVVSGYGLNGEEGECEKPRLRRP